MADRRRIVRRPSSGTVVVQDLDDGTSFRQLQNSFKVVAPQRNAVLARRQRRYGGQQTIGELHDNGAISFLSLVQGSSAADCLTKVETLLSVLESPRTDLFFEWRPEGAGGSTYYEIRGPATYALSDYQNQQLAVGHWMKVEVTIPVAPLAQLERVTQTFSAPVNMGITQIPDPIGGTAPALVDVGINCNKAIYFMLIGWMPRAGAGPNGKDSPFVQRIGPDTAGGDGSFDFSMTNVTPDDFSDETDLEIWAWIYVPIVTNPRAIVSIVGRSTSSGSAVTSARYTAEWGQVGTPLFSTSNYQLYKLGAISVPVNPDADPYWSLNIDIPSTAKLGRVLMVPARSRACTITGQEFARLFLVPAVGGATTKTIRGEDLSGIVKVGTGEPLPDSGLGGSPIEMQPGLNDLVLLASSQIPNLNNDFQADLSYGFNITLTITPRVWLAGS